MAILTYNVDVAHSSVNFKVKHMQVSNVKGNFKIFKGTLEFDEDSKKLNSLEGEVEIASVNTNIKDRDNHLRTADFFDAEKYPTMVFKMKEFVQENDEEGTVKGELTIKNITKVVDFEYELGGISKNQEGKSLIGLTLKTEIKRTEFNVGSESILIGDKIKIDIELEAYQR